MVTHAVDEPPLLGGRYERLRRIASGGMASVHLGRAIGLGGFERLVAIKLMHPHLATDQDFVEMFLDEARLAAAVRHPNVVATLDVDMDGEELFLVMDYVEGPSLFDMFRALRNRAQRMPVDVVLRIVLDTLAGLHAAHELCDARGEPLHLVHRDVSPHNVLVGADGIARIADFGIARAEQRLSITKGGKVKGKMLYMPPEQLGSGPVDRRLDVYAAGVVLWEALAARRLFRAEHEASLMHMILTEEPLSPCDVDPSIPAAVGAACMHALAKSPAHRYPTAAAFADVLERAARESGIHVASTRGLAAFVAQLGAHVPAAELLAHAPPPRERGLPPAEPALHPPADLESDAPTETFQPPIEPLPRAALASAPPRLASDAATPPAEPIGRGGTAVVGPPPSLPATTTEGPAAPPDPPSGTVAALPSPSDFPFPLVGRVPSKARPSLALWALTFAVGALAMGITVAAAQLFRSDGAAAPLPAQTIVVMASPPPAERAPDASSTALAAPTASDKARGRAASNPAGEPRPAAAPPEPAGPTASLVGPSAVAPTSTAVVASPATAPKPAVIPTAAPTQRATAPAAGATNYRPPDL
jgi:serine/threonine protein kinase